MGSENKDTIQIEGFKKWDPFYQFIKEKYTDISNAILNKDFEISKRTLRELIDNTCPYHNNKINVVGKNADGKEIIIPYEYEDYFELVVDTYEKALIISKKEDILPNQKEEVLETFNHFYQQIRLIRRLIIRDMATAGIIPTPETKKNPKINKLLTGEDNEDNGSKN